ncbi:MAG: hypothetical protein R3B57_03385 [Phycisphaerales bacterium]
MDDRLIATLRARLMRLALGAIMLAPISAALAQAPTDRVILHDAGRGYRGQTLIPAFSRPVPTVDPLGAAVAPDEPRYDQPEVFTGEPRLTQITQGDYLLSTLYAAGSALDGTPLWFYARRASPNASQQVMDLFATEPSGTVNAPGSGSVYHRWNLADVWNGHVPGALAPFRSASIYQGAVVVATQIVVSPNPGGWGPTDGLGIFVGNHDGTNMVDSDLPGNGLHLIYTDSELGMDTGGRRVRNWSVTGPFVTQRDGSPGTDVWFCVGDYRYAADDPTGGVWVLIHAHRPTESDPWTFDPPCEVIRVEQDSEQYSPITHAHPAGVAWDRNTGRMTFVAIAGDWDVKNALFAVAIDDPSRFDESVATYSPPWWTGAPLSISFAAAPHPAWLSVLDAPPVTPPAWGPINFTYHGASNTPNASPIRVPAFQPLGISPGPTPNQLILGGDNEDAVCFARLDVEESPVETGAILNIDHVMLGNSGYQALQGPGFVCYEIRNTTPQNGGPYLAAVSTDNFKTNEGERLLLGLPDGDRIVWGVIDSESFGPAYMVNGVAYRGWRDQPNFLGGLRRIELGGQILSRPLRLGMGGTNVSTLLATSTPQIAGSPGCVAQLVSGPALDALPPRPFLGPVVHLTMDEASNYMTLLDHAYLRQTSATFAASELSTRVWVLAGQTDPMRSNKLQLALGWAHNPFSYTWFYSVRAASPTCWIPVDLFGKLPIPSVPDQPIIHVESAYEWAVPDRACDVYIGLDSVVESLIPPGYPLPPDEEGLPLGAPAPSEASTITGFGQSTIGSLMVAGMVPHDGYDYGWFDRISILNVNASIPLFSIIEPTTPQERQIAKYRRPDQRILPDWLTVELVGGDRLVVRTSAGSSVVSHNLADIRAARGDTFQFAIRWRPHRFEIDGVWGGERIQQSVVLNNFPLFSPDAEFRFGGIEPDHDELTLPRLSVFGAGFWSRWLDQGELKQLFHDVSYLDTPPPPAPEALADPYDLLDWRDVTEFLRLFSQGDPRADLAAPFGVLDTLDVRSLLDALSSPTHAPPPQRPAPIAG